jgi:hypothetical protein
MHFQNLNEPPSAGTPLAGPPGSEVVDAIRPSRFSLFLFLAVVALNLLVIAAAWLNQGWSAVSIAWVVAPMLHGSIMLGSLISIPLLRRRHQTFSVSKSLALSLSLPMAAILIDWVVIAAMHLSLRA